MKENKSNPNRLFVQLKAAVKSWVPNAEEIRREDTMFIGELQVLGRPTYVWLLKPGGFNTGEASLAGFHVTYGVSHIALSPCKGDDLLAIFIHELAHCIHWHTCAYESLSTEGTALLCEHAFRLYRSNLHIHDALISAEASLNEEGGEHGC